MELFSDIAGILVLAAEAAAEGEEEEGGSFLVTPGLGLMIWTVFAFLFTMFVLSRFAFPYVRRALEKRANLVSSEIDAAQKQRKEADELLAEYRQRLKEAREQADDIIARAKKAGESVKSDATEQGRAKRDELVEAARKDIETETRRSLERIRKEVADLTVLATEKVARKALTAEDQKRLVEEALGEIDFSTLAGEATGSGGAAR